MEEQKKTTAEKKAKGKGFPWSLIRWICMAPLAFIWWVFTFKMAGYSFTALVCLCLIGILLFYNVADTWFIGQTDNPYMVAATSLVATIFLLATAIANIFGVGGGNLVVRLIGSKQEEEAKKVASWSIVMAFLCALGFSVLCLLFMNPILYALGASDNTIGYAR